MTTSEDRDQVASWTQRQLARERGDLPISREFGSAIVLLGSLAILSIAAPILWTSLAQWTTGQWSAPGAPLGSTDAMIRAAGASLLPPLGLALGGVLLMAVGVGWLQAGGGLYWNRLRWDFSRLNGFRDTSQSFPVRILESTMGLVRWIIVWTAVMAAIWASRDEILAIAGTDPQLWLGRVSSLVLAVAIKASGLLALVGIADYLLQWWRYERRIAMSPDEVRQEMQAARIDPSIVHGRRRLTRSFLETSLSRAVSSANRIIADKSGIAVGLKNSDGSGRAPIVVFRTARPYSDAARTIAAGLSIAVEDHPLAAQLFDRCRVGDEVPRDLAEAIFDPGVRRKS